MKSKQYLSIFMLMSCLIFSAYNTTERKQTRTDQSHTMIREIAVNGGH